jgi:hypothetical protein
MGLKGSAFLAIWHDIARGGDGEFVEWHTREHMPERLSISGFRAGKRLHAPDAARHVFGTIYAGDALDVFRSPAYLDRLNNPTPWTEAVAPTFRNFLRIACERVASAGTGDGGSMATLRFDFAGPGAAAAVMAQAQGLAEAILSLPGACGVHVGVARGDVSGIPTRETQLRGKMAEKSFDVVILIEGSSRAGLAELMGEAERLALGTGALASPESFAYEVAYQLIAEDMRSAA